MQNFCQNVFNLNQSENYRRYYSIVQSYWQLSQDFYKMNQENQKIKNSIIEVERKTIQLKTLLKKQSKEERNNLEEFDRKFLANEMKRGQNQDSLKKSDISQSHNSDRKRIRKPSQKGFKCPYKDCGRRYDTSVSLNLHMKLKHKAGTKKERETFANQILLALQKGKQPPMASIQLPPQYLQKFRMKKLFKQKYNM